MFNKDTLKQLKSDVGSEALIQLFGIFEKESARLVQSLCNSSELMDESERLAHSLKSCAKSYGADELSDIAAQLELAAKENNETDFASNLPNLSTVYVQTMSQLPTLSELDD